MSASSNCTIWFYSTRSKHCWWRLDGKWDVKADDGITAGCAPSVANCGTAPWLQPTPAPVPTPPPTPSTPLVLSNESNQNGEYFLSNTPKGNLSKFPTHYKDYPGGVYSFDVLSPVVSTLYSQVWWAALPAVRLPQNVIDHFNDKTMAVVGFELDQVRQLPNGSYESLPMTFAYNHHFESNMVGKYSRMEKVKITGPNDERLSDMQRSMGGHGIPEPWKKEAWVVRDLKPDAATPTSQSFGGANGGEVRKSYHGYAPGYAQLIQSPQEFHITPMQIDTWNRDKMKMGEAKFHPGPVPSNSWAPPADSPDAIYSGLLECPLTTRITKIVEEGYSTLNTGTCDAQSQTGVVMSATECYAAAAKLGITGPVETKEGVDASLPAGCTVRRVGGDTTTEVFFNKATDTAAKCGAGVTKLYGNATSLVTVSVHMDAGTDNVTITISGPSDVWFGVGFNASAMKDDPWAVVVEGNGKVSERKLRDQNGGSALASSVTVISQTVSNSTRTVVLSRALKGATANHYTFSVNTAVLPFINAVGSGVAFSYHKSKNIATLAFVPEDGANCICTLKPAPYGQGKGHLHYTPTNQKGEAGVPGDVSFGNHCGGSNSQDLLDWKNPTCDVRGYLGGQTACHHMWSLLDADQDIPWADQPLQYHLKFRFWVQDFKESDPTKNGAPSHQNVKRTTWGIASPVEYDVPKCGPSVPGCTQQPDGNWVHTIQGTYKGSGKLVAAHFHCHAPTCLSMKMMDNETGEVICEERPIYGGTNHPELEKKYDEPGYILQPPCLWGDNPELGLQPPIDVNGRTLYTIKTSNATYGHHGEMAWQQMYFV